jgi:NAD(P)H dehydrogenase (quinone)
MSTHHAAPSLAVTGATGAVGGLVARELAPEGSLRLLARDPDRAPHLDGTVVMRSSYDRPGDSLADVETLFMVSGSESADRLEQHLAFVDAAAAAGVRHIVYTSFLGASDDSTFTLARDHAATERGIRDSGVAFTFLRDNFYADVFPLFAGEEGVIRGPAGDGRVSAVARADVARVAAQVLRDPGAHAGAVYDLTGPEAFTLAEAASVITRVTGRDVRFHDETVDEAYESRRRWDAPQWQYDAWVSTYTAIASGELAAVSRDVERITCRPPLSLVQMLEAARR